MPLCISILYASWYDLTRFVFYFFCIFCCCYGLDFFPPFIYKLFTSMVVLICSSFSWLFFSFVYKGLIFNFPHYTHHIRSTNDDVKKCGSAQGNRFNISWKCIQIGWPIGYKPSNTTMMIMMMRAARWKSDQTGSIWLISNRNCNQLLINWLHTLL